MLTRRRTLAPTRHRDRARAAPLGVTDPLEPRASATEEREGTPREACLLVRLAHPRRSLALETGCRTRRRVGEPRIESIGRARPRRAVGLLDQLTHEPPGDRAIARLREGRPPECVGRVAPAALRVVSGTPCRDRGERKHRGPWLHHRVREVAAAQLAKLGCAPAQRPHEEPVGHHRVVHRHVVPQQGSPPAEGVDAARASSAVISSFTTDAPVQPIGISGGSTRASASR